MSDELQVISNEPAVMVHCPKCGRYAVANQRDKHLCDECAKAENTRYTYYRQHQDDWITNARENGLEIWVQQPGETQWEFTVWTAYRDSYPGKKPSYSEVAVQLGTTYNVVKKIAQRWSFPLRMQVWIKYCDDITLIQRRTEILDMNKDHISMSEKLRTKLNVAINQLDPNMLDVKEIVSLAKLAADMERSARLDVINQEDLRREALSSNENPDLKKTPMAQNDLSDVIGILVKAGALGKVGVRQVTEVVMQPDKDA